MRVPFGLTGEAARVELPVATVAPQKVDAELTRLTSVQPNTPASPVSDTSTTKPSSQSSGAAEKSVKSSDAKNGQKGANDQDKDKKGSSSKGSPNSKQSSLEKSKRDAVDHKPDSGGKEEKRGGKRSSDSKGVKRQLDDKTSKGNGGRSSRDKDTGRESPRSKKPRRGDRRSQSPSSRDSGEFRDAQHRRLWCSVLVLCFVSIFNVLSVQVCERLCKADDILKPVSWSNVRVKIFHFARNDFWLSMTRLLVEQGATRATSLGTTGAGSATTGLAAAGGTRLTRRRRCDTRSALAPSLLASRRRGAPR